MSATTSARPAFDLKSTSWTLTALRLQTADVGAVATELDSRFGDSPGLFDNDPVVIDLSPLCAADAAVDFDALLANLRRHRLRPIAAQGGSAAQMAAAAGAGLAEALSTAWRPEAHAAPDPAVAEAEVREVEVVREVVREVAVEVPASAGAPTLVIDKPLRSGQRVYARGGDLVVLAVVSFGAEVIADGSIHVYAPLRGRAIAGARGDIGARIFSSCMEPQLVSIAGIYRTTETPLPEGVVGKLAQVRLDGEKIIVEPLGS